MAAAAAIAQPFGRFGYTSLPSIPGFTFNATGFRSSVSGSDWLRFPSELKGFRATEVSDRAAVYSGPDTAGLPSKIRVNLRSPGFEMSFSSGFRFEVSSLGCPYLSWTEGSVGSDVPTPPAKWILVSFQDSQPPVLLVFDSPTELITIGKAGQWAIVSRSPYKGTVRVCLPVGHYRRAGIDAASLGQSVLAVKKYEDVWTAPRASLVDYELRSEPDGVVAVWTFDRPGALVPPAALLGKIGGYPALILSGIKTTEADLWDGPVAVTTEAKLAIKFPIQRVPIGRSLTLGKSPSDMIASASPFDYVSLSELAVTGLLACRDRLVLDAIDSAMVEYLAQTSLSTEVHTQQKLPFSIDGTGIDLAAAHALLQQCRTSATGIGAEGDLFTKVAWRRDWYSWMVWVDDQGLSRRASAMLAIAGALSPDPGRRLEGAMLQCGLAAERALRLYRQRRGFADSRQNLVEPFYNLRAGLFRTNSNAFVDSLLSEVRVVTDQAVTAESTPEGITIRFTVADPRPGNLTFEVGRPVDALAVSNLKSLIAKQALGRLSIDYEPNEAGECVIMLRSPGWSNPLPQLVAPPRYSES